VAREVDRRDRPLHGFPRNPHRPGGPRRESSRRTARRGLQASTSERSIAMNLQLTGHHLDITPAIRDYVTAKLARIGRHFDHVIEVTVVLSVDKLQNKAEATLRVRGKDLHAERIDADMFAAIDGLADRLDRQVVKYKELLKDHRADPDAARAASDTGSEGTTPS
jgi:putative sigma-54 modulation protein